MNELQLYGLVGVLFVLALIVLLMRNGPRRIVLKALGLSADFEGQGPRSEVTRIEADGEGNVGKATGGGIVSDIKIKGNKNDFQAGS
ncbi:hypothetical protein ACC668_02800 [Rhizobium ruizarguesonis]